MRARRAFVATLSLCLLLIWTATGLAAEAAAPLPPPRYLPQPPAHMTLCGQPVPLDNPAVAEMLDREFQIAVNDQAQVVMWLKRAGRYFPYIEKRLAEAGLPDDLKYLAVAESSLIGYISSPAGARGLWQFIQGTGLRYGLRQDRWFDDRLNPEKATSAAIAYLKELHEEFNSWPLAMASYNCGESRLRKEMGQQGVRDYYELDLPSETERYVYRILAVKAILGDPARYGYRLPPEQIYRPLPAETATLKLGKPLHLRVLASATGVSFRRIRELNPEIRGYYLPSGVQVVKVPPGQALGLSGRLGKAVATDRGPQPEGEVYVVKSGDSLASIARKAGVKIDDLRKANEMDSGACLIRPGQRLLLPEK